jgi:hypothetical protein
MRACALTVTHRAVPPVATAAKPLPEGRVNFPKNWPHELSLFENVAMVTGRWLRASTLVVVLSCGWPAAISSDPRVAAPATAPAVAAPRAWCAPLLPGPRSAERNAAGTLPCVVPGRGACDGGCRRQRCVRVACCIRLACATGPAVCASIPEPRAERLQAAGGGAHRDASLRHCPRCAAARGGQRCAA